jgi:predicted AlkP superfamily phosphohydrolase/phosphomutase
MTRRVLAIGLDGAEQQLIERWSEAGLLPTFGRLRESGAYARLHHIDACRSETLWTMVQTGCLPQKTGYWLLHRFDPDSYTVAPFAP